MIYTCDKNMIPSSWCNSLVDFASLFKDDDQKFNKIQKSLNVAPKQPLSLLRQSNNFIDQVIPIPDELKKLYTQYRPTPFCRAFNLEHKLETNAHIYYKFEGANISGSHKLNTALAQAFYYKKAGVKHVVTGTGAGQWGTAIAYACKLFNLKCTVFMVGISLRQKPQRRMIMEAFGATVYESPTDLTETGKKSRLADPLCIGSLAIASGEAIELANNDKHAKYAVGSGENSVLLHQTIIGLEAINQLAAYDELPDYVVACMGTGSNFGGISLPFMRVFKETGHKCRFVAAEPVACPKFTKGKYAYDINDFSGTTPLSKMFTLGSTYLAPSIHAAGLLYHGTSRLLSALYANKEFDAVAIPQNEALQAGLLFAETEGILPAPESAHAIAAAINIIKQSKNSNRPIKILINISGHGNFDLLAYDEFVKGHLDDGYPCDIDIKNSLRMLDEFNKKLQEDEHS